MGLLLLSRKTNQACFILKAGRCGTQLLSIMVGKFYSVSPTVVTQDIHGASDILRVCL